MQGLLILRGGTGLTDEVALKWGVWCQPLQDRGSEKAKVQALSLVSRSRGDKASLETTARDLAGGRWEPGMVGFYSKPLESFQWGVT